jgi:hypothetical protein
VEEIANLCDGIEFDVSLGLAGSEVAGICATFRAGGNTRNSPNWLTCPIPIGPIAPGTRVSVRCRYRDAASQSAKTQYVKALYYPTVPAGISLTTRPFRSATPSSYITLTTSSSAWANPAAFTEIIAATAAPWQLSQVLISEGDIPFNSGGDEIEIDVATGPASSEVVQTTVRIHTRQGVAVSQGVELDPILAGQIPAGVRVSMRARHRRAAALTFGVSAQYYEGAL